MASRASLPASTIVPPLPPPTPEPAAPPVEEVFPEPPPPVLDPGPLLIVVVVVLAVLVVALFDPAVPVVVVTVERPPVPLPTLPMVASAPQAIVTTRPSAPTTTDHPASQNVFWAMFLGRWITLITIDATWPLRLNQISHLVGTLTMAIGREKFNQ